MNKKNIIQIAIYIIVPCLFLNCWKKQDSEVTRPVIPHYRLNGSTLDYDSKEFLPHVKIQIQSVKMVYSDAKFTNAIIESDSTGRFEIEPVYPGSYVISINTENAWHSFKNIEISYADRTLDLLVPQVQFARVLPKAFPASSTTDITYVKKNAAFYIEQNTCYINCTHSYYPLPPDEISVFKKDYIRWVYEKAFNPVLYYDSMLKMTCNYENLLILAKNDTIISVNKWTGFAGKKTKLTGVTNLKDLIFNRSDNNLYACTITEILKLSTEDYTIQNTYQFSSGNIEAMAYCKNIYTFDKTTFLLSQHGGDNFAVTRTFVIINSENMSQITKLYDFDFDSQNNMWVMPISN